MQRGARRSALVEALFTGVIADRITLWDAARELGLPERGPYAVVAAAADSPGMEPLPGVEAALREAIWRPPGGCCQISRSASSLWPHPRRKPPACTS